jgi:hypothetical protein
LACFAADFGCAWGVWTYKKRGKDKKLIADLQVKQTLKQDPSVKQTQSTTLKRNKREAIR